MAELNTLTLNGVKYDKFPPSETVKDAVEGVYSDISAYGGLQRPLVRC